MQQYRDSAHGTPASGKILVSGVERGLRFRTGEEDEDGF